MPVISLSPKTSYISGSEESYIRDGKQSEIKDVPLNTIAQRVSAKIPELKKRDNFTEALERNGAGTEQVAAAIGEVLANGRDHDKLRASEMIMKSMGLFDNASVSQGGVVFQFQGDHVNLQAVLQPQRKQAIDE